MNMIRLADKDGWSAALNYLSANIAETEAEGKATRKSKKEAEHSRESQSKGLVRYNQNQADDYSINRYTTYRSRPLDRLRNSNKKYFGCQRWGHIEKDCDQS